MYQYIVQLERELLSAKGFGLRWIQLRLFIAYILFGMHRAINLLFAPAAGSFTLLTEQSQNGTWQQSYLRHQQMKRGARMWTWTTPLIVVVASGMVFGIMQVSFPSGLDAAEAATVFEVTNANDSGAGSFRQALIDVNAESLGSENIILLKLSNHDQVELLSALPNIQRQVDIQNFTSKRLTIDGRNLGANADCLVYETTASGSAIEGMEFTECPQAGISVPAGVTEITIGDAERLSVTDSKIGIEFGGANTDSVVSNVIIGRTVSNTDGPIEDYGILVEGSGSISISGSNIYDANVGVQVTNATAYVSNSYIGGHDTHGIAFSGTASGTVFGSSIGTDYNSGVIANGEHGIYVNSTGTVSVGNSEDGNTINNNADSPVFIEDAGTVSVLNNEISGLTSNPASASRAGVVVDNTDDVTITGNDIFGIIGDGVQVVNASGTIIASNNIGRQSDGSRDGNSGSAVNVINSTDVSIGTEPDTDGTADSNVLSSSTDYGVEVSGSSDEVLISKNTFDINQTGEISITGDAATVGVPVATTFTQFSVSGTGALAGGYVQMYDADGAYVSQTSQVNDEGEWTILDLTLEVDELYTFLSISADEHTSEMSDSYAVSIADDDDDEESEEDIAATLDLSVSATDTTATITSVSSENVTARLDYGRSSKALNTTKNSNTAAKNHEFSLSGLTANTTYVARVTVTDSGSNTTKKTVTFTTDSINVSYLYNTTINNQTVYSTTERIYVGPGGYAVSFADANNDHQVRVRVKDEDGNVTDTSTWTNVVGEQVSVAMDEHTVDGPHTLQARSREKDDTTTDSAYRKIATVEQTRQAPRITTLEGEATVTTRPQALQLGGSFTSADSARVRVLDRSSGELVASCSIAQGEEYCELPYALGVGEYTALFETVKNGVPSAPDSHHLIVAYPQTTSTFTTDTRSGDYYDRVTTSGTVNLVGLGPAGAVGTVLVDDQIVATVSYTSDITWTASIPLDGAGITRGESHVLEVLFSDTSGNRLSSNDVSNYPFYFANRVVTPSIADVAAQYEVGANFTATVTAGVGNTVRVFDGTTSGTLVYTATVPEPTSGVLGSLEVPIPTSSTGSRTMTVTVEDNLGLQAQSTVNYTVVGLDGGAGLTEATPVEETVGEEDTTDSTDTETSEDATSDVETETATDNTSDNTPADEEIEAPDTQDEVPVGAEEITAVNEQDDISAIPTKYRYVVSDTLQRQTIKDEIDELNVETINIDAQREVRDADTEEVIRVEEVEYASDGSRILRATKTVGLPSIQLPFATQEASSDVLTFSGTSAPYALVNVTIYSDPVVTVARADSNGQWTLTVDVDELPAGSHTAFLSTESRGVQSDQLEIAKFVVLEEQSLSNTSWIFIINMGVVVAVLLIGFVIQIRHRSSNTLATSTGGAAALQRMEMMASQSKTDTSTEDDDETTDDDDSYHSALGV